jgi:hypothetical protein
MGACRAPVAAEHLGPGGEAGADRPVARLDVRIMLGCRERGAEWRYGPAVLRRRAAGERKAGGGKRHAGQEGASVHERLLGLANQRQRIMV